MNSNQFLTSVRYGHLMVPEYPQLTITSSCMARSRAVLALEPFVDQIRTATGIAESLKPYVRGQLLVHALRSQAVSPMWFAQKQRQCIIGSVIAYPEAKDSSPVTLENCAIINIDMNAHDGTDPTVKITIGGIYLTDAMSASRL